MITNTCLERIRQENLNDKDKMEQFLEEKKYYLNMI